MIKTKVFFFCFSGGHMNPAITFGVLLVNGLRPAMVLPYMIAQILGGLLGAALTRVSITDDI